VCTIVDSSEYLSSFQIRLRVGINLPTRERDRITETGLYNSSSSSRKMIYEHFLSESSTSLDIFDVCLLAENVVNRF
jgi:hypothetical protein